MALRTLPPRLKPAQQSRIKPRKTEGGKHRDFYQSPQWRQLRAAVVAERGRRCERCGDTEMERIHCDHVVEMADGGAPLDRRNIVLLCIGCHNRKTADAVRVRQGGMPKTATGLDGWPIE